MTERCTRKDQGSYHRVDMAAVDVFKPVDRFVGTCRGHVESHSGIVCMVVPSCDSDPQREEGRPVAMTMVQVIPKGRKAGPDDDISHVRPAMSTVRQKHFRHMHVRPADPPECHTCPS